MQENGSHDPPSPTWREDAPYLPFLDEVRAAGQHQRANSFISEEGTSLGRRLSSRGRRSLNRLKATLNLGSEDSSASLSADNDAHSSHSASTSNTAVHSDGQEIDPVTGVAFANERDNADFHRAYPSIDDTDRLIDDFACAWNKEGLLIQGRMWISQRHVCFKGWTQSSHICIQLAKVKSIEKRNIALVIPNSMEIETERGKYFFASFFNRDTTYDLLTKLWRNNMSSTSSRDSADDEIDESCTCDGLGTCESCFTKAKLNGRRGSEDARGRPLLRKLGIGQRDKSSTSENASTESSPQISSVAKAAEVGSPILTLTTAEGENIAPPTPPDSPPRARSEQPAAQCQCGEEHRRMRTILDNTYPVRVEDLWTMWFSPKSDDGDWYGRFLVHNRKVKDLAIGPWVAPDDVSEAKPLPIPSGNSAYSPSMADAEVGWHRKLEYIMPLTGPIGPKQTKCIVDEQIVAKQDGAICLQSRAVTPDVPSGQAFHVITRICLLHTPPASTHVVVSTEVVFTKSSWIRAAIEKATPEGQSKFFKELDLAFTAEFTKKHAHKKHIKKPVHHTIIKSHLRGHSPSPSPFTPSSSLPPERQEQPNQHVIPLLSGSSLEPNLTFMVFAVLIVAVLLSLSMQAVALYKVVGILEKVEARVGEACGRVL
ncbi:uncharacterized protein SPPG_03617 [Spizellomyces punctatus DAOM BR117]|uniref:VASt domain-containing protein n=1 Tax=Spizellomyces punctatus (strain DAOM BR117) TaxID=645134 RepID=A0A0L0HL30_SPIPD|nr:uncharacterized protein SPPG_03617 [Spizellomyces punctatus DAOM BR117]KND01827.1 hypothetical protein SPPG_03617 [Spizellomyces punctatus DAOM BR117]|eukprot:XP_016609866.1 hypothetical protein SPPG_03617 [Spizellomyces punctatus DAOM BR117]